MIRPAEIKDMERVKELVDFYSIDERTVPRSLSYLYNNVRDYLVFKKAGKILGCASLHVIWSDLAEIKSLAVHPDYIKNGIGKALVRQCIKDAKRLKLKRVFVLTKVPEFFENLGFRKVAKRALPQKVYGECMQCSKYPHCDEKALLRKI